MNKLFATSLLALTFLATAPEIDASAQRRSGSSRSYQRSTPQRSAPSRSVSRSVGSRSTPSRSVSQSSRSSRSVGQSSGSSRSIGSSSRSIGSSSRSVGSSSRSIGSSSRSIGSSSRSIGSSSSSRGSSVYGGSRSTLPSRSLGTSSRSVGSSSRATPLPRSSSRGTTVYTDRFAGHATGSTPTLPSAPRGSVSDSARSPSAGALGERDASSGSATSPPASSSDLEAPSRSRRIRFPAPYRSSIRSRGVASPDTRTADRPATGIGTRPRTGDRGGAATPGGGKLGQVRYGSGPLRRLDPKRVVTREVDSASGRLDRGDRRVRPVPSLGDGGTRRLGDPERGLRPGDGNNGSTTDPRGGVRGDVQGGVSGARGATGLRGSGISAGGNGGAPHDSIGSGVAASGYRGGGSKWHDSFGHHSLFGHRGFFRLSFHYGYGYPYFSYYNPCYWWFWPYRFLCHFPYYYHHYRPYFRTVFYPVYRSEPATTTVVYVDSDPVGEAVVPADPPLQEERLPIAAERYLTLGDRAFREGRYTDAVQFYAKAVEFAPDQGALFLVLSDALFAAGDYHYGAYAIRRAFELEPSLADATVDKRTFYADPAEFDRQLAVLERYVADHSTDRDARLVLALNLHFGGRSADAQRLLEDGRALADDFAALRLLEATKRTR